MASTSTDHIVALPGFTFVIRIIVMVLSVIILGLAANSVASASLDNYGYTYDYSSLVWKRSYLTSVVSTSAMGYVLFVTLWSLIGNAYLILTPLFLPVAYNMWAHLVFEVLSWVWWLGAWAAAAGTAGVSAADSWFSGITGKAYTAWASAAAAAGLGAIVWILHLIIGIVFCVKLHRHRKPSNAASPYGAAEKHEMGNVAPQPPQQQQFVQQDTYPAPTPTPAQYVATPPPQQWQQSPPPHPQGGQY